MPNPRTPYHPLLPDQSEPQGISRQALGQATRMQYASHQSPSCDPIINPPVFPDHSAISLPFNTTSSGVPRNRGLHTDTWFERNDEKQNLQTQHSLPSDWSENQAISNRGLERSTGMLYPASQQEGLNYPRYNPIDKSGSHSPDFDSLVRRSLLDFLGTSSAPAQQTGPSTSPLQGTSYGQALLGPPFVPNENQQGARFNAIMGSLPQTLGGVSNISANFANSGRMTPASEVILRTKESAYAPKISQSIIEHLPYYLVTAYIRSELRLSILHEPDNSCLTVGSAHPARAHFHYPASPIERKSRKKGMATQDGVTGSCLVHLGTDPKSKKTNLLPRMSNDNISYLCSDQTCPIDVSPEGLYF